MDYSEDHIALAAEYALGTLDADERAQVEQMMAVDKDYAAVVDSWERALAVLNQMVGLVEPGPQVWENIRTAIGMSGQQASMVLPQTPEPVATPVVEAMPEPVRADTSNVIDLSRRAQRWRGIATTMTAIAAALIALIGVQATRPDLLPAGLRPKPEIQVVQAPTPAPTVQQLAAQSQYVALLQTDATSPAFILTVDAATKNFTVRRVGAEPQTGKSYELWIVSDKFQAPRSLGVIGGDEFTTRAALASYDPDTVNAATYAVTVEPEGGSPTGSATGPIVFTGKLIETVPPPK
ncbi:anti-sigma factor [Tardiphaga alba]|uniref:Regulator of SigK n=1 Tax=Tardiphaga alba TaxID=340268 RepID=A0ABX8AIU7_9BRAD|nr:anti-sigma factor [Tardiphaga alba]QUS42318.1 anti-sigma factor [Tardiphaga alba]